MNVNELTDFINFNGGMKFANGLVVNEANVLH